MELKDFASVTNELGTEREREREREAEETFIFIVRHRRSLFNGAA